MYFSTDYKAVEFHVNIEYVHNIMHVFLYMYKQKYFTKRGVFGQLIKQHHKTGDRRVASSRLTGVTMLCP